jgi:hypothetical protein
MRGDFLHHNLLSVSQPQFSAKRKIPLTSKLEEMRRYLLRVAIYTKMQGEIYVGLKRVVRIAVLARKLKNKPIVCDLKESLLLEVVSGSIEENDRSIKSRARERSS